VAVTATPKMVMRKKYEDVMRDSFFGETDVYNLPFLETITEGKTTRLVKDQDTGNILVGYKEDLALPEGVQIDGDSVVLKKIEEGVLGVMIDSISVEKSKESSLIPGDIIVSMADGSQNCSKMAVEEVKKSLAEGCSMKVVRELFKPAWLEPRVWGDEGERQRTYFNEQKFNRMRKARLKSFRSTPGVLARDITVFERGRTEGGFGQFKNLFQRSKMMGEGSFGQVFDGTWKRESGNIDVVLKRSKDNVIGALEMLQLELILNKELSQRAPSVVSPFLGFVEVSEEEEGQIYDGFLSTGLWLMWEDLSARTLDTYIMESYGNNFPQELSQIYGGDERVLQKLGTELFKVLEVFHKEGLVHRDVKPENLLVLKDGSIRLIDLGATASCLRKPLSYEVGVGPQDPAYTSPTDGVLLPEGTDKPTTRNLPQLWEGNAPDRFDVYAAATVLLQLACPTVREREGLIRFQEAMGKSGHDFSTVKQQLKLTSATLDKNNGQGWDLLSKCFEKDRKKRPSSGDALEHPFFLS